MNANRERLVDALELINQLFADLELPEQIRLCKVRRLLSQVVADMDRDPGRRWPCAGGRIPESLN
jgi:hypothetical protein